MTVDEHATVKRLVFAARHHVRSAGEKASSDDEHVLQDAAIHAGVAVELLAKAVLARVDERLLRGTPEGIYHALLEALHSKNGSALQPSPGFGAKTVTANTALSLVSRLKPELGSHENLRRVLLLRNAAAHMAEPVDQADLAGAIADAQSFAVGVIELIEVDVGEFITDALYKEWKEQSERRDAQLRAETERLLVGAREQYERLVDGLEPSKVAEIDAVLVGRFPGPEPDAGIERREETCPACHYALGVLEYVLDVDYDVHEGSVLGGGFVATQFDCPRCGLHLEPGRLRAAGIDDNFYTDELDDWRD